jgi:hypothetical protein
MIQIRFDGRSLEKLPLSPAHRTPVFASSLDRRIVFLFGNTAKLGFAQCHESRVGSQEDGHRGAPADALDAGMTSDTLRTEAFGSVGFAEEEVSRSLGDMPAT